MRNIDLLHNYSFNKPLLKASGISDKNVIQVVADSGVMFTNLSYNERRNHKLNSVFQRDAIFFIFPEENEINLKVNGIGTMKVTCPADKITVFSRKDYAEHDFYLEPAQSQDLTVLSVDYSVFESFSNENFREYLDSYYNIRNNHINALTCNASKPRITESINKVKKFSRSSLKDNPLVKTAIKELQYLFIQHYLVLNNHNILDDSEIENICKIPVLINNDFASSITVEHIASQIGMSRERLQLGCEIVFKCGIRALINEIKLEKIANLLFTTNKALPEIVYENGYVNRGYFYKIFTERFQCDPLAYRAKCQ